MDLKPKECSEKAIRVKETRSTVELRFRLFTIWHLSHLSLINWSLSKNFRKILFSKSKNRESHGTNFFEFWEYVLFDRCSMYERKKAVRRFVTIYDILRSLSHVQSLPKGRNAPIWRQRMPTHTILSGTDRLRHFWYIEIKDWKLRLIPDFALNWNPSRSKTLPWENNCKKTLKCAKIGMFFVKTSKRALEPRT